MAFNMSRQRNRLLEGDLSTPLSRYIATVSDAVMHITALTFYSVGLLFLQGS